MSLRDLVVTAVILGLAPFCVARPWVGILAWSWLGYLNPHRLTWGFAYSMPFGMIVMGSTLIGLPFARGIKGLPHTREIYLLFLLWGWFVVTTIFAFYPEAAWEHFWKVSKVLLGTFLTILLLQEERKCKALIWVIALSVGFFGFKGGIWATLTGGGGMVLGPPESFIAGNTEIGLAINMTIPLLVFLRRQTTKVWLRQLLLAIICLSVPASLMTYSRGALLGLAVILPLLFLKSRAKLILLPILIVGTLVGPSLMPIKWTQRMETIQTYQDDTSANQRLNSWWVAYQIAKDSPVLGGGFRTFSPEIYETYMPGYRYAVRQHDAHNIFLQVLAEHGYPGFVLFAGLIVSTLLSLRGVILSTRDRPDQQWINDCARMLEVSLAAYLVSGMFLSMSYFDLFYHLVAITVLLKVFAAQPVAQEGPSVTPALATARRDLMRA